MAKSYKHLDDFERVTIQTQLQMGLSPGAIAAGLNRSRSTVTRELERNGWKRAARASPQSRRWGNGGYLSRRPGQRARQGHRRPRVTRTLAPGNSERGHRRAGRHQRPFLDAMTLIDQRPAEVDQRRIPGH